MATFKSTERIINADVNTVYQRLSHPEGFKNIADNIPSEVKGKVNIKLDGDVITIVTPQVGDITFKITKRVENEKISLESISSPLPFSIDMLMAADGESTTKAHVETKIELNPIIKPMISKPIQEMTEKFAEFLTQVPFV